MNQYKQAFTLIELLVVVLVIGILASVALPQYQKAVIKSRLFAYMSFAKSIVSAQETYYLAHGEYALSLKDLDVEPPNSCQFVDHGTNTIVCGADILIDNSISTPVANGYVGLHYCPGYTSSWGSCASSESNIRLNFYFQHYYYDANKANTIVCVADKNTVGKQICQAFNAQNL